MILIGSFIYSRQYVKALMMFVVGELVCFVGHKDDIKMFKLASHEVFHFTCAVDVESHAGCVYCLLCQNDCKLVSCLVLDTPVCASWCVIDYIQTAL